MSIRLGDSVLYGELRNDHYSTHGWVILRGEEEGKEEQLILDLTGDCSEDLQGKHIRFYPGEKFPPREIFRHAETPIQMRQIGPTGIMTAQGWVRMFQCSVEEFIQRSSLGEPPPTTWERHLYLEWYGQNGCGCIEMGGCIVEYCVRERDRDNEEDEGDWALVPNREPHPDSLDAILAREPEPPGGPEITTYHLDEDGTATIEQWTPRRRDAAEEHDGIPADLERQFEQEAAMLDRAIQGMDPETNETIAEMETMDYCIEHSETRPFESFFDVTKLPRPEDLDDARVESALKQLLTRMAILSVALNVCEHYSPRDCYRLLLDTIIPESGAFEELVGTGWVTHFSTSEYCEACEEKFEAEFEERERQKKELPENGE